MSLLPSTQKGWIAPVLVLFAGIAILVAVIALRPQPAEAPAEPAYLPPVSVIRIDLQEGYPRVETTGRVTSRYEINLVPQVSGQIDSTSNLFRPGASFRQGDLLATLDDTDYRAQLVQAEAQLASARQQLASEQGLARQAQREWRDLGNAEANALFLREPQLASAQAQIEAAEAALERARIDLQRTRITAPFDGVVVTVNANQGQYVSPGTPLAVLNSTAELQVETALSTTELEAIGWSRRDGDLTRMPDAKLTSSLWPRHVAARISHISPRVDSMTQLTPVLLDVVDDQGQLTSGQFVQVEINGSVRDNLAWIPQVALYERAQVLRLDTTNSIEMVPVQIVSREPGRLLVAGLNQNDRIVTDRPLWVFPGQQVQPGSSGD